MCPVTLTGKLFPPLQCLRPDGWPAIGEKQSPAQELPPEMGGEGGRRSAVFATAGVFLREYTEPPSGVDEEQAASQGQ